MPLFNYLAKDIQGVEHRGTIETVDAHQVSSLLTKKGLVVINIKQIEDENKKFLDRFFGKVSFSDVVIVTRQLATMVESGLVVSEALDILADQQTNPMFKKILEGISRDVKSGLDLATSLKKHPDVFSPLYANLVKAGEQAGKLDVVLTQMANNLEKDREFRARIRGAMIYPVIVIVMMFLVMLVMIFFVIPRLTTLYSQSNIDLPLPTKILIGTSSFFINFWWAILAIVVGIVFTFRKWVGTPTGKMRFDSIMLSLPVVGKVTRGTLITNFTRTFGLLITAGIPILDSLTIVADVLSNSVYKQAVLESVKGVERGLPFSTQLEQIGVFPKIVSQMFRVGEETGKVDQVSFKLAEYFETETDNLVKNLTVIIEPVVLVVLGLGVAFLVLSIILPIYKLTTSFS